jgi:hypothetical protein
MSVLADSVGSEKGAKMSLRHGVVVILMVAIGCTGKEPGSPTGATSEAGEVNAQELCDAYWKGDERFTGKVVSVTGHLVNYGGGVGADEKDVTLGTDRDGNSGKWVGFKVTAQEFANIPTLQFGELINVKGTCVGARKKEDVIMVQLRDCRFIRPVVEKKPEKKQP